jgi:hypothetical protein
MFYAIINILSILLHGICVVGCVDYGLSIAVTIPTLIVYMLTGIIGNPDCITTNWSKPIIFLISILLYKNTRIFKNNKNIKLIIYSILLTLLLIFESIQWFNGITSPIGCLINRMFEWIFRNSLTDLGQRIHFLSFFWCLIPTGLIGFIHKFGGRLSVSGQGHHEMRRLWSELLSGSQNRYGLSDGEFFREYDNTMDTLAFKLRESYESNLCLSPFLPIYNNGSESPIKSIAILIKCIMIGYLLSKSKEAFNKLESKTLLAILFFLSLWSISSYFPIRLINQETYWFILNSVCIPICIRLLKRDENDWKDKVHNNYKSKFKIVRAIDKKNKDDMFDIFKIKFLSNKILTKLDKEREAFKSSLLDKNSENKLNPKYFKEGCDYLDEDWINRKF